MNNKFLYTIQVISIGATIVAAVILTIIGSLGKLSLGTGLWLLIAMIGSLSVYLLTTNVLLERRIEIIEKGEKLSYIISQKEWYEKLIPSIRSATNSIDITHHEPRVPMVSGIKTKKELFNVLVEKIKKSDISVRWIMAVNSKEKMEWTIELIEELKDCDNFSLRWSSVNLDYNAPPQSVQVIDDRIAFVIDMSRGHHTVIEPVEDLMTTDPAVVQQFKRYYNRYWEQCNILKEGTRINHQEIENLKKQWSVNDG
ncbi:hypothetical protein M1N84_03105 [Dehalococcoidia bacterium]|nr:hypothetical protein [Dehalococcoidia bacterium]MCL0064866.1 hypothetical protein [Dehalococcoidia bacterium]